MDNETASIRPKIVIDSISFGKVMCGICKEQFRILYGGTFIRGINNYSGVDICRDCLVRIINSAGSQKYKTTTATYFGWPIENERVVVNWNYERDFIFGKKRIKTNKLILLGPAIYGVRYSLGEKIMI